MSKREPVFLGACTAVVTPFDDQGAVDYDLLGRLVEAQISRGIDALCVCGTTGECATLSLREHMAVVDFCVRRTARRVTVIAGAGSNDTSTALYLSQHAQDAGADALLLVTPYYNKTTQEGLVRHYSFIAERTDLPIILYNVPARTGVSFTPETYRVLAQNPHINGVKEAGGLALAAHTLAVCPADFSVWSGSDELTVPMMSLGARGVVSVASNLAPEVMVEMSHLCLAGEFRAAAALQLKYLELLDALSLEVNPIPIKAAMDLAGLGAGRLRLPLCPMSSPHLETLRQAMERSGLLGA